LITFHCAEINERKSTNYLENKYNLQQKDISICAPAQLAQSQKPLRIALFAMKQICV